MARSSTSSERTLLTAAGMIYAVARSHPGDWRPEEDGTAIARLKQARAIVIGKTNVPTALGDWQSASEIYGFTRNPLGPGAHAGRFVRRRAAAHDHNPDFNTREAEVDGVRVPYFDQLAWPGVATVAGLPIGVAIDGPFLEDRTTIGFARIIEPAALPPRRASRAEGAEAVGQCPGLRVAHRSGATIAPARRFMPHYALELRSVKQQRFQRYSFGATSKIPECH